MTERLYAPGPVAVPPEVLEALSRPVMHHRTAAFRELFIRVRGQLAALMGAPEDDALLISGSGSSAFEAAFVTSVPRDTSVLALGGGKFAERWASLARRFDHPVEFLDTPWGTTFDPQRLAAALALLPPAGVVTLVHSETSTGVLHDVAAITAVVRRWAPEALVLVDAVTSLAVVELKPHEWGVDALVSGSQKGVMLPPGLGFVWLSERAWARAADARSRHRAHSLDLHRERERQRQGDSGTTPATSMVVALGVALERLFGRGLENHLSDLARRNQALLAGGKALMAQPFAQRPSPAVAAMRAPQGIAAPAVVAELAAAGLRIAGGQDQLKDFLLRPSLLGDCNDHDVLVLVEALERAFSKLGAVSPAGAGRHAASAALLR
jgi:aspartate aminotransferase-like enzyme